MMIPADHDPQILCDGLSCETRHQGQCIMFTLTKPINRDIVDRWHHVVIPYLDQLPTPERFILYDLSQAGYTTLSHYAREKIDQIARQYPDATGKIAIIYPQLGVLHYVIDLFIRYNQNRIQRGIEIRLFTQRDQGLAWLTETLH